MTDVHDTQTDIRQKHRLMPPPISVGHNNTVRQIKPAQLAFWHTLK